MNRTTPDLLSSTNFFRVVLVPSLVSISPPKSSRLIVSPTSGTAGLGASFEASLGVSVALGLGAGLLFFSTTGGGAGALRLRSSTIAIGDGLLRIFRGGVEQGTGKRKRDG